MTGRTADYDIVIRGGRVMDPETMRDEVADVAVVGDRVVSIGPNLESGDREIDAKGLVVAPGFVDIHAHGQSVTADRMQAFDGVTTALELEVGALPVGTWYDSQAKAGRVLNYGASAAWIFARKAVMIGLDLDGTAHLGSLMAAGTDDMRWSLDVASEEQLERILALMRQGLDEGGLGIGIPNGYAPGAGVIEVTRICEIAKACDTPTYTHIPFSSRTDPKSTIESYIRLIGYAGATGAHMHICHFNSGSLLDAEHAAALVQKAQAHGLPITTEAYPYGTGSTFIGAGYFADPEFFTRMGTTYNTVQLVSTKRRFESLEDIAAVRDKDPALQILWHFLDIEENPAHRALLDISVLFPGGAIASDALPWNLPDGSVYTGREWPLGPDKSSHPRSSGTFTRFLRHWVRERNAIPLMDAIAKCTLIPARIIEGCAPQLQRKGRLQEGLDADIVVFDPQTVAERATFEQMHLPAEGMVHVLVNGQSVISDGVLDTTAAPGLPIKRG
jgi:N-acyl-D-glutamate deacylase